MTTKEWLRRGIFLERQINALKEEREKLFALVTKSTGKIDDNKVQVSTMNGSDNLLATYADYSLEIERQIDHLIAIKHEIIKTIDKVSDPTLKTLLMLRYVNIETWKQVANEMNYSKRQTLRLHKKALEAVEDVLACHL